MRDAANPGGSIEVQPTLDMAVVVAVNDDDVLEQNLKRSPLISSGTAQLRIYRNCRSIAEAYNAGLRETEAEYVVFAHQDVYFPKSWAGNLASAIDFLDKTDPTWAVLGVYGVQDGGRHIGTVWSSGLGSLLHQSPGRPQLVVSLDELAVVVRRSSGVHFDAHLPNFHLYGTDIVLTARSIGRTAYAAHLPVIHNSRPNVLGRGYMSSYLYMQRKWWSRLPVPTAVIPLTKTGFRFWYMLLRQQIAKCIGRYKNASPRINAVRQAEKLGYE